MSRVCNKGDVDCNRVEGYEKPQGTPVKKEPATPKLDSPSCKKIKEHCKKVAEFPGICLANRTKRFKEKCDYTKGISEQGRLLPGGIGKTYPLGDGGGSVDSSKGLGVKAGRKIFKFFSDEELYSKHIYFTVRRHASAIHACYEKNRLDNPNLAGKVVVTCTINKDGNTENVKIESTTLNNKDVEDFLLNEFKRMKFAKPFADGIHVMRFPYNFEPYLQPEQVRHEPESKQIRAFSED